ncbi:unnamed protein product [Cercospora beticola]|nr:unnamed protein product [Cercospora beticola]
MKVTLGAPAFLFATMALADQVQLQITANCQHTNFKVNWLPDDKPQCVVLRNALANPFQMGSTTYKSVCCSYAWNGNRQTEFKCTYNPRVIEDIHNRADCLAGHELAGCIGITRSSTPSQTFDDRVLAC